MNEQVKKYIENYPAEIVDMFKALRQLIYDSVSFDLVETMWAKLPSYYAGETFVRLIPFKDHINIESQAVIQHKEELANYKITPDRSQELCDTNLLQIPAFTAMITVSV